MPVIIASEAGRLAGSMSLAVHQGKLVADHPRKQQTQNALKALIEAKVLMPWPEGLVEKHEMAIDGLLTLNEKALAQLPDEDYLALRKVGAIALGYALSFSLNQLHLIGRLKRLNGKKQAVDQVDLEKFFGEDDDGLKF